MSTLINYSERKARKEHNCDFCDQKINIGEIYSHSFCKDDYVYVWKNHISCHELIDKIKDKDHHGVSNSDFYEYIIWAYYDLFGEDEKTFEEKTNKLKEHYNLK